MKKLFSVLMMIVLAIGLASSFAHADIWTTIGKAPYDEWEATPSGSEAADVGKQIQEKGVAGEGGEESITKKILIAFGIDYYNESQQTASFYIKKVLNYFLAIAALVALIVLILGFYKMFAARDSQEGFKDASKFVINVIIGIVIMGVSRFIVSWFFDIYLRIKHI